MSLLILLVLHHVGDVAMQPSWLIANKRKHGFAIYEHVMVYSGVVSAGLYWLGLFQPWMFAYVFVGHFLVDYVKYLVVPKRYGEHYWHLYVDQGLHYVHLAVLLLAL